MPQQPEPNGFDHDFRNAVNWLYLLANAHTTCITMFIRHSPNTEARMLLLVRSASTGISPSQ